MKKNPLILQNGRSLVEVMIALTLGLVVLLAVSSMFIGNRGTYRSMDDKARMDEEGRLGLQLIAQHIRMAGYGSLNPADPIFKPNRNYAEVPITNGSQTTYIYVPAVYTRFNKATSPAVTGVGAAAIFGCPNGFSSSTLTAAATALACANTGVSGALMVRYEVDVNSGNVNAAIPTDCLGLTIPPLTVDGASFFIIDNRFYVQNNQLFCQGNGTPTTGAYPTSPILDNVEQMSITYGLLAPAVDSSNTPIDAANVFSQSIQGFVTADRVTNWNQVGSVRICLIMRSANDGVATAPQNYFRCDGTKPNVGPTDRRLRSAYISTVAIRGRTIGAGS